MHQKTFGLPANIPVRLFLVLIVLGPALYVTITSAPIQFYGIGQLFSYVVLAATAFFALDFSGTLFALFIGLCLTIMTCFVSTGVNNLWLSIFFTSINFLIVVTMPKFLPWFREFVKVGPYFRAMVLPVAGFIASYFAIVVWFAAIFFSAYLRDRGAFSGVDEAGQRAVVFWKFLYFSLGTILPASAYSDIKPVSVLVRISVSVETLIGSLWLVVVFAGVIAFLTPRFSKIAEAEKRQGKILEVEKRELDLMEKIVRHQDTIEKISKQQDEKINQLLHKSNRGSQPVLNIGIGPARNHGNRPTSFRVRRRQRRSQVEKKEQQQ